MKKKMILVSTLVVMAMSAMFVACSGNTPTNGCVCTIKDAASGETYKETITQAELEEEGITSCSKLNYSGEEGSVSCKAN